MRTPMRCLSAVFLLALTACGAGEAGRTDDLREELVALERASHRQWLASDVSALDELMADDFHFVAMNGALEPKSLVVGAGEAAGGGERALQVEDLEIEPERVFSRGNSAVVIGLMRIDATVRGRPLPDRMRVLSVYTKEDTDRGWRLTARSITPVLDGPDAGRSTRESGDPPS